MDFNAFSPSRAVGLFDLLTPPLTPIKTIDGQKLLEAVKESVRSGSRNLVIDCSGISFIYSDTLNVLGQMGKTMKNHGGSLGILSSHPSIIKTISTPSLQEVLTHYTEEFEMLQASVYLSGNKEGEVPQPAAPSAAPVPPPEASQIKADASQNRAEASQANPELSSNSPAVVEAPSSKTDLSPPEEPQTREMRVMDEGIGASFLNADTSSRTTELPLVEEVVVASGKELSKELDDVPPLLMVASKPRGKRVLWAVLILATAGAAAYFFGIFSQS